MILERRRKVCRTDPTPVRSWGWRNWLSR